MNNIYKVIWNKASQTWIAVSELASGYSRSSRSGVVLGTLGSAFLLSNVLLAGFSISPVAHAVSVVCVDSDGTAVGTATGTNTVACGDGANAAGTGTIAVGNGASVTGTNSIVVGKSTVANTTQAIAIGTSNSLAASAIIHRLSAIQIP